MSLVQLQLKATMLAKGYKEVLEPFRFKHDHLTHIPFNNDLSIFTANTASGHKLFFWDFLYNEIVERDIEDDIYCQTTLGSYINSSGFIIPISRAIPTDKRIIYDEKYTLVRAPLYSEYQNLGDRIIIIGDDGVLYCSYIGPLTSVTHYTEDGLYRYIKPWMNSNSVYECSSILINEIGPIDCINVFPKFSFI